MTDPARRRHVEEVCHSALDRAADERAAFVAVACGDDEALRQDVEALLAHSQKADGFLVASRETLAAHVLGGARAACPACAREVLDAEAVWCQYCGASLRDGDREDVREQGLRLSQYGRALSRPLV